MTVQWQKSIADTLWWGAGQVAGAVAIVQQQDRKPFEWRTVIGVSLGKYRCTVGGTSYI